MSRNEIVPKLPQTASSCCIPRWLVPSTKTCEPPCYCTRLNTKNVRKIMFRSTQPDTKWKSHRVVFTTTGFKSPFENMQFAGKLAARVIWYCNPENITEWENQEGPDVRNSSLHSVCIRGHHFLCCWVQREHFNAGRRWRVLFFGHFSDSKHINTS